MRIALVTGSFPPNPCGVGDYTARLADALGDAGVDVHIITGQGWNVADARRWKQRILACNPDIVHLQYPTVGYGKGLAPQGLALLAYQLPFIVTLHEFSQAHILRRIADLPFGLVSGHVIFTSAHERGAFTSWLPWVKRHSSVINIGSNIPSHTTTLARDPHEVAYFGLFRPSRGLEDFIELAKESMSAGRPYRFAIVGTPAERYGAYYEEMKSRTRGLPIEWEINLPPVAVAERLSRAMFAYLPFPDGASERRGSLLAALSNALVTITTQAAHTSPELAEVVCFANTPRQALSQLDQLYSAPTHLEQMGHRARTYAQRFSWPEIAQKHVALYHDVVPSRR